MLPVVLPFEAAFVSLRSCPAGVALPYTFAFYLLKAFLRWLWVSSNKLKNPHVLLLLTPCSRFSLRREYLVSAWGQARLLPVIDRCVCSQITRVKMQETEQHAREPVDLKGNQTTSCTHLL